MIIGIGGISRAGKSTIANLLVNHFEGKKIAVLHQDEYIKAGYDMPWIKDQIDWEDPESIDFQRLRYDFHWLAKNVDILIHEGLFAFYNDELNKVYHKKILVELDFETFYSRKKEDKRWGEVPEWYFYHIWNSYYKYGKPHGLKNLLQLNGNDPDNFEKVIQYIGDKTSEPVF